MGKELIEVLETAHTKLSKLEFDNWEDFLGVFIAVIGYNFQRQIKRIFDDDPDTLFIDFASELLEISKSDLRKLMKNNGIKVNNKPPTQNQKMKDLEWIELGEWKIAVIKIGKNRFDFIMN